MKPEKLTWDHLVVDNPMLIEITRFRRKWLTFSNGPASAVGVSLAILVYAGLVLWIIRADGLVPPLAVVTFQLAGLVLATPALLHGAIAGERERRSWDFLLVAPLTKAQIVVGKFFGAVAAQAAVMLFCILPIALSALTYHSKGDHPRFDLGILLWGEAISASFSLMVGALCLLFSARSKRGFTALGTSLGVLAVFVVVVPAFVAGVRSFESSVVLFLHPFDVLFVLMDRTMNTQSSSGLFPSWAYGFPQVAIYLVMTVVFLLWAIKTLVFAENEVKFMPQKKVHNA